MRGRTVALAHQLLKSVDQLLQAWVARGNMNDFTLDRDTKYDEVGARLQALSRCLVRFIERTNEHKRTRHGRRYFGYDRLDV